MLDTREIMSQTKFYSDYSRYDEENKKYEEWEDSVERVMNMHKTRYADELKDNPKLLDIFNEIKKGYSEKLFLGAQRALQFGGPQLLKNNMRGYNCSSTYADRIDFFGEFMWVLLSGAGIGVSVQGRHIEKLPNMVKPNGQLKTFTIKDSIEGWADAKQVLVSSFFEPSGGKFDEWSGKRIHFEYDEIRDQGSFISGGFKAPGPEPLRKALIKIEKLLHDIIVDRGETRIKPIEVYDICMFSADAVIAGGVRRAATIFLFSPDDTEMLKAKTGNWFITNPQRKRSNNSVVLLRNKTTFEEFEKIMESVKGFGEPGFVWVEDLDELFNPCVSENEMILTENGRMKVKDLINTPFNAVVNGKSYKSNGFFKTGIKQLYKLSTDDGYNVEATYNHKILTTDGWKELQDIRIGKDEVILNNNSGVEIEIDDTEFNTGWLVGNFHGDGTIARKEKTNHNTAKFCYWGDEVNSSANFCRKVINEKFKLYEKNKESDIRSVVSSTTNEEIPFKAITSRKFYVYMKDFGGVLNEQKSDASDLLNKTKSFKIGYVSGIFDADGCFQGNKTKGYSLRLTQKDIARLRNIQLILSDLGIKSKLYEIRNKNRLGAYNDFTKSENGPISELIISRESMFRLAKILRLQNDKYNKMYESLNNFKKKPYSTKFKSLVTKIEATKIQDVYDATVEIVHRFDANGIIVHNCVEIGMFAYIDKERTKSGIQGCNLTEINAQVCITEDLFYHACYLASAMGTIQAGYTKFPYLSETTKQIFEREALIGVSITGWMNNPEMMFDSEIIKKGAQIVKDTNKKIAKMLGINPAARTTCSKPSGNASVILKTSSGIGAEKAKKILRYNTYMHDSDIAQTIKRINPQMIEEGQGQENSYVIAFPYENPDDAILDKDMTAIEFLKKVEFAYRNWVETGTNTDLCVLNSSRHNISNTVSVGFNEWEEVTKHIFENRNYFSGISLMGAYGDRDYAQAPFTEVKTHEEIVNEHGVGAMFASGLIVDSDRGFKNLWEACYIAINSDIQELEGETGDIQKRWVSRFRKFADQFFNSDYNHASLCLKDVHILFRYEKIVRNYVEIDFSKELGAKEYVDINKLAAIACAGGTCEIEF